MKADGTTEAQFWEFSFYRHVCWFLMLSVDTFGNVYSQQDSCSK